MWTVEQIVLLIIVIISLIIQIYWKFSGKPEIIEGFDTPSNNAIEYCKQHPNEKTTPRINNYGPNYMNSYSNDAGQYISCNNGIPLVVGTYGSGSAFSN